MLLHSLHPASSLVGLLQGRCLVASGLMQPVFVQPGLVEPLMKLAMMRQLVVVAMVRRLMQPVLVHIALPPVATATKSHCSSRRWYATNSP